MRCATTALAVLLLAMPAFAQQGESFHVDQMEFDGSKPFILLGESITFTYKNDQEPALVNAWCTITKPFLGCRPGDRMDLVFADQEVPAEVPEGGRITYTWDSGSDDTIDEIVPGNYVVTLEGFLRGRGAFSREFEFTILPRESVPVYFRTQRESYLIMERPWAYLVNRSRNASIMVEHEGAYVLEKKINGVFTEVARGGSETSAAVTLAPRERRAYSVTVPPGGPGAPKTGEYRIGIRVSTAPGAPYRTLYAPFEVR